MMRPAVDPIDDGKNGTLSVRQAGHAWAILLETGPVRRFSLWFGKRPTVSAELRALVEVDLTRA